MTAYTLKRLSNQEVFDDDAIKVRAKLTFWPTVGTYSFVIMIFKQSIVQLSVSDSSLAAAATRLPGLGESLRLKEDDLASSAYRASIQGMARVVCVYAAATACKSGGYAFLGTLFKPQKVFGLLLELSRAKYETEHISH